MAAKAAVSLPFRDSAARGGSARSSRGARHATRDRAVRQDNGSARCKNEEPSAIHNPGLAKAHGVRSCRSRESRNEFPRELHKELLFHDGDHIVVTHPPLSLSNLLGIQIREPRAAIGAEQTDA
jgi:hypothetical protein